MNERHMVVHTRMRAAALSLLLCCTCVLALPVPAANGQILDRIKSNTAKKIAERKEKAESTVVKAADRATDSTLEKTGRGVDATVNKAGSIVDTVLNKTERGVQELFVGGPSSDDQIVAGLRAGRMILRDVEFAAGSEQLSPASDAVLIKLAHAIQSAPGVYLVEGHTDSSTDVALGQALSERRAVAIKARLVMLGIPGDRLFAMGYGATRPLPPTQSPPRGSASARIEVARMQ